MSEARAGVMQRTAGPGPRGEGGWLARLKKGSLMALRGPGSLPPSPAAVCPGQGEAPAVTASWYVTPDIQLSLRNSISQPPPPPSPNI